MRWLLLPSLVHCNTLLRIPDTECSLDTVDHINSQLYPDLQNLLAQKYFRYHKTSLNKKCTFWNNDNAMCTRKGCSVEILTDTSEIPPEWDMPILGDVDFSVPALTSFGTSLTKKNSCDFKLKDFCVSDRTEGESYYVDLLKNPERFTGYDGEASAKIWRAIYNENCFTTDARGATITEFYGLSRPFKDEQCLEKRVFYKLISGLHASISTHICRQSFNATTNEWYPDLDCYLSRVENHKDRLENLYFTYVVVLRAIVKIGPYLANYDFCVGDTDGEPDVQKQISQIVSTALSCPQPFNENSMFSAAYSSPREKSMLKEEFKTHFRNVSRIMDCVTCEKCRLWGKLQVGGLGTALKVLYSYKDDEVDYKLTRSEIVRLVNAFGRLSQSIQSRSLFKDMYKQRLQKRLLAENMEMFAVSNSVFRKSLFWGGIFVLIYGVFHVAKKWRELLRKIEERDKKKD